MNEEIFKKQDPERVAKTIEELKARLSGYTGSQVPNGYIEVKSFLKENKLSLTIRQQPKFRAKCVKVGKMLYASSKDLEILKLNSDYYKSNLGQKDYGIRYKNHWDTRTKTINKVR